MGGGREEVGDAAAAAGPTTATATATTAAAAAATTTRSAANERGVSFSLTSALMPSDPFSQHRRAEFPVRSRAGSSR